MNQEKERKQIVCVKWPVRWPGIVAMVVLVVVLAAFIVFRGGASKTREVEVTVVSTLQRIIDVSDLSTFTAVYNGIAEVPNEKNPDKIDYYVSYEARVEAGIDFSAVTIGMEDQTITVDIPDVKINDIIVDISSLDFIFFNDRANQPTVTQQAFKACEEDARTESECQEAILELAQQNAVNVATALVKPIVDQLGEGYQLVVE